MTRLTTVAAAFKKAVVIAVFGVMVIFLLWTLFSAIKKSIKPKTVTVGVQVNTVFEKLPAIVFPTQTIPADIRFSIETLSGTLPDASPTAKVYFFPKKQRGLLTNITTNRMAEKVGFSESAQSRGGIYYFSQGGRSMTIDSVNKNFTYDYNYQTDGTVFEGTTKLDKNYAISTARAFLSSIAEFPADFADGETKVSMQTFNGAAFIPLAQDEDEAKATSARVDFIRDKVDGFFVVASKFNEGAIFAIVSKHQDKDKQVIKAQWQYQQVDQDTIGVYPVRSASLAWNDFLAGKGYIAAAGDSLFTKRVVIRDATIGYYDSPDEEAYLMPVYIFSGEGGFAAYANAIDPQWLIE